MSVNYWLMKTEPHVFGIEDLKRSVGKVTAWEGVRNYQARNFLKQMQLGDLAFFYHSSCKVPAIVGVVELVRTAYPDLSNLTAHELARPGMKERWVKVDVKFCQEFAAPLPLQTIKGHASLASMKLVQKGQRLSVQPVTRAEFDEILQLANSSQHLS